MRRLGLHTGSGFGEETVHIVCPQTVPPSSSSVSWGGGRQSDRRGNTPSPDQTDKEFSLPDQAPWPRAVFGTTTLPLAAVHLWPEGAMGSQRRSDVDSTAGAGRFHLNPLPRPDREEFEGAPCHI
uniref:Uncharacterized protein n=1 Tax=Eutreptiella gymnastica TaxID=73025 RepID=A0A7S4GD58_9EUGL|mmetsp:Transcript_84387/g.141038  ORF Transcript_84387/g.141038 Transcript_84387/m.141038 type:complete len:125 (+) Transcript_84387:179-553(+)